MAIIKDDSERPAPPSSVFKLSSDLLIRLITMLFVIISITQIFEAIFFRKTFDSDLDTTKLLILVGSVVFITLLNVVLGLWGIKKEKITSEIKLLSIEKPILLTVKTDKANLQKNIDFLSQKKQILQAEVLDLDSQLRLIDDNFYKVNDQIHECEEKSGQRVERTLSKARNLKLAFVSALFSSAIFGTYLVKLYLDFNSEYSSLISFLLVFLLDLGLAFIFANSLLILEVAKKFVPILNIILIFSLLVLSVLVVTFRSGDCLYCNYLFPLLHLNLGLVAGIFYYQYQTLSWATDLAKEKRELEKRLEQLKLQHRRSLTDIEILNNMINSHQKKLKIQTVDLENPRL